MSGDVQALWARLLLATLAQAGVRDVIVSPGSRSTPFLLAALELAALDLTDRPGARRPGPRLRLHDVIDERCAAFFALGRARVTGRPALLLCTSGTAGANYFPALVEAGQARVPVLALTADRPLELVDCGANQTIDQAKLFGGVARDFVDLGLADPHPSALAGLRRAAARAVTTSLFPDPGPVHLNARARKPLEPSGIGGAPSRDPDGDPIEAMRREVDRLLARPLPRPRRPRAVSSDDLDALARRLGEVERGLVVAGPAPVEPADERGALAERVSTLADRLGWPVAVDLASQLRAPGSPWADGLEPFWSTGEIEAPGLILQLGRGPTSTAWGRWLQHLVRAHGAEHWIVSAHGFPDAESTATHHVVADPETALAAALDNTVLAGRSGSQRSSWRDAWLRVRDRLAEARAEIFSEAGWSEAAIARAAVSAVPAGGLLMLGNSLPIRLADVWGGAPAKGVGVLTQRGASGIDGLVSGAAGSASANGEPTLLVLGDVSLRHDLGGLALAARVESPLVVLVIHNSGGRIFERLPVARYDALPAGGLDHWITPEHGDFEHAAAHFGLDYARVGDLRALDKALARGLDAAPHDARPILVEARVSPHGAAEVDRALVARLRRELGGGDS